MNRQKKLNRINNKIRKLLNKKTRLLEQAYIEKDKQFLNSLYGKMVYADTDTIKEKLEC